MPIQGSTFAADWDAVWNFILWASIISIVILIGAMIVFILRYQRKSDNDKVAYITHNTLAEFLWSFIPLVIFMIVATWGWFVYKEMRNFPTGDQVVEVNVMGQKWAWTMTYPNGKTLTNELVVPAGRPVVLHLTSKDVIHSFYVPSFRIKQDAVPGYRSKMWFQSDRPGTYNLFCTEYCGTNHSGMIGSVKVVSAAEYAAFESEKPADASSPIDFGKQLYKDKVCFTCHTTDGTRLVGPSWKGIWGQTHKFVDGSTAVVDENYIRESILEPNKHVVEGYLANQMPSYQGQLKEEEITALIEFIKSLK